MVIKEIIMEEEGEGRGRHRFRCGGGEQTSLEILLSRLANNIRAIIGEKREGWDIKPSGE